MSKNFQNYENYQNYYFWIIEHVIIELSNPKGMPFNHLLNSGYLYGAKGLHHFQIQGQHY